MKLLVVDYDGTLYPKEHGDCDRLYKENIEAVKKWLAAGNKFVVATGRSGHTKEELEAEIGQPFDYIGVNGGHVILADGSMKIKDMPLSVYIDLCEFVKEKKADASLFTHDEENWIWSGKENYPWQEAWFLSSTHVQYVTVFPLDKLNPATRIKSVDILVAKENRDKLMAAILKRFPKINIIAIDVNQLKVSPDNIGKGLALIELCQNYNIDFSDVIVVGDSHNDIPMFALVEKSYCMYHGEEAVKAKAAKIANTVKEVIDQELSY